MHHNSRHVLVFSIMNDDFITFYYCIIVNIRAIVIDDVHNIQKTCMKIFYF
jgi:hypothetical protein